MARSHGWVFTINNPTESDRDALGKLALNPSVRRLKHEDEVAETGTPHIQGYVGFHNARQRGGVVKLLGGRAYAAPQKGSDQSNDTYCGKTGVNCVEVGEPLKPGRRTDLDSICKMLWSGTITYHEILRDNPMVIHKYGRTIDATVDAVLMTKTRPPEMPTTIWYYGKPGAGKSHKLFAEEKISDETHYVFNNKDKGWWDGYRGQETIIINDLKRDQIDYGEMLQICDKWPYRLSRRGRSPVPCLARRILISSVLLPHTVWPCAAGNDCIEQLLRRITLVEVTGTDRTEVPRGVIIDPLGTLGSPSLGSGKASPCTDPTPGDPSSTYVNGEIIQDNISH